MKIVYLASGNVSVYDSQVLSLLDFLVEQNHEVFLVQGYKDEKERYALQKKQDNHLHIPVIWYQNVPTYPFYEIIKIRRIYEALTSIPNFEDAIIHVRGSYVGFVMKKILQKYHLRNSLLVDIRGAFNSEYEYKISNQKGLRKLLLKIQKSYINKCWDYLFSPDNLKIGITSVSPLINDYLQKKYPSNNHKMYFHPNISGRQFVFDEQSRKDIRNKYQIGENDILAICATGGNSIWQKDYQVIQKLIASGAKVINLSKVESGIDGCVTTTVPFSDMPKMLSAADVAVLWRDDDFLNNAASPSKFSEFAAMGLYVIHNKSVKVASDYIGSSGAGQLVDCVDNINLPCTLDLRKNREKWCQNGLLFFGIDNLGASYLNVYRELRDLN